ncbi:hypothetical protein PGTUg99_009883 [Puccinia graminis f. sp. tritici]|uniref:Uncharacterized protein n=1 Tax=Puccinia graminis f. sp. tritici TaxID=56615 RepID=A0A5B0PC70_PUCGR|nr:hypothetical protein PGTUg99_009883 [Puccinia graminis f. sp. tritici]
MLRQGAIRGADLERLDVGVFIKRIWLTFTLREHVSGGRVEWLAHPQELFAQFVIWALTTNRGKQALFYNPTTPSSNTPECQLQPYTPNPKPQSHIQRPSRYQDDNRVHTSCPISYPYPTTLPTFRSSP